MTLVPKPIVTQNFPRNFELEIPDETGTYSVDNPGGWDSTNAINPDYDDIEEVHMRIIHTNGLDATAQINSSAIPWPNATGLSKFVSSDQFGLAVGEPFADGKIICDFRYIGYDYTGGSEPSETALLAFVTVTTFLYGQVRCCVQKMWSAAFNSDPDPDCDSDAWKIAREGRRQLNGLINAIECKQYDHAQIILEDLQAFCLANKMNCGC